MQATTLKEKINLSHAKAIRRSRELMKLTRTEVALRLGITRKAIQKYEAGRAIIDEEKLDKILKAMELAPLEYEKIRKGKTLLMGKKEKTVFSNQERRSYKKIITKQVRVLKILRQMKNLTQDQASAVCGYSRPSIGHIENGRIELDEDRIQHIVSNYGHAISEFNRLMKEEVLRDEIMDECCLKMVSLPEEKLQLIQSLLRTLYCAHFGKKLNRFSIKDHINRLRKYTAPWLELIASDLNKVDGRRILSYAESLSAKSGLLNKIKSSINLVYNWGSEEGLISVTNLSGKSPVYGLGFDDNEEKMKPILTLDEVRKFLLDAKIQKHPWYPIWAFAVLTGMRSGELMALQWGDVDEKNGIIRVSKSNNKRLHSTKCTKNGTWRNVDINTQLAGIIADLKRSRMNETNVLTQFPEWKNGLGGSVLRMFLERIGIKKDVVFHTLKACFATHLLSTGVEPLKVMRMGGWSDLKTFQIYLRMSGMDVRGVAEGLDVLASDSDTKNVIPLFL